MENPPNEDVRPKSPPALTINVQSWATPVIGLIMLVLGLLGGYFGRPLLAGKPASPTTAPTAVSQANPPQAAATPDADQLARQQQRMQAVVAQTRHFQGDPKAPVTIIEFSDFQWPFCGRFATGAARQIQEQYINTGKVRFGYIHFAFLGEESFWAAEASECAGDQDKFWEYHDLLFDSQSGENKGAFSKDNLKAFAADMSLDTKAFNECLDSGKYTEIVKTETQNAQALGVSSTPSFLVNGRPVVGAQEFSVFQQYIEEDINKQ